MVLVHLSHGGVDGAVFGHHHFRAAVNQGPQGNGRLFRHVPDLGQRGLFGDHGAAHAPLFYFPHGGAVEEVEGGAGNEGNRDSLLREHFQHPRVFRHEAVRLEGGQFFQDPVFLFPVLFPHHPGQGEIEGAALFSCKGQGLFVLLFPDRPVVVGFTAENKGPRAPFVPLFQLAQGIGTDNDMGLFFSRKMDSFKGMECDLSLGRDGRFLSLCPKGGHPVHRLLAHVVQEALGHHAAFIMDVRRNEGVPGISQAGELLSDILFRSDPGLRFFRHVLRCQGYFMAFVVFHRKGQAFPGAGLKTGVEGNLMGQVLHGERPFFLFQHPVHMAPFCGPFFPEYLIAPIPLFPHITGGNKGDGLFLRVVGKAGHFPLGHRERRTEEERGPPDVFGLSCIDPMVAGSQGRNHVAADVVIQVGRSVAPVELLFQGKDQGLRGQGPPCLGGIDGLSIEGYRIVHVFRALHAAFHLQGSDAGFQKIGNTADADHVFQGKNVISFVVPYFMIFVHQMVRHAAGLGTGAPVSAAAADEAGHEALAGIADAESPMDEDFDFHSRLVHNVPDFRKGQFPGQHHPLEALGFHEQGAVQVGNGHLGAGMEGNGRSQLPHQGYHAEVLQQEAIDGKGFQKRKVFPERSHFHIADEGIQGHVHRRPVEMGFPDSILQFVIGKVARKLPGAEELAPKVNRISPGVQGRSQMNR